MHIFVRLKRTWDRKLSSGWMMSGQLNSFFCGFYHRWFEEDLGSEVVFWFVAQVHVHSQWSLGKVLVGEFMVGFLLVFTVLRTAVNSDFFIRRWHALQQHVCVRWCHHLCQAPRFVRFHVVWTETCRTILFMCTDIF